jgi:DNA-binding transcriptional ArsR family regulator
MPPSNAGHTERLRALLGRGPASAEQLVAASGVSQPVVSRTLAALGDEVLRLREGRSIRYAVLDRRRGLDAVAVYCVTPAGQVALLGHLSPVCPDGFVMTEVNGAALHSEGLPWWLQDLRPAGFLGRAFAARHADALGLPAHLHEWDDTHTLRALLAHGHDAVGNLLLGERAQQRFLTQPPPAPLARVDLGAQFAARAQAAAQGEAPGTSAGGEQPKFTAYVEGADDPPTHRIVKFSLPYDNPVTARWRDLLLAEHHALTTLAQAGIAAAATEVIDHAGQRFLAVERFDRVGATGRCGLLSLAALDAEFVGQAQSPWPVITDRLAAAGHITSAAAAQAALLYAYGTLIGNSDMHAGNLSFTGDIGRACALAPAYDMLPMALAPRASGDLPDQLPPPVLRPLVAPAVWRQALDLARALIDRLQHEPRFSDAFQPALQALAHRLTHAQSQIDRLA